MIDNSWSSGFITGLTLFANGRHPVWQVVQVDQGKKGTCEVRRPPSSQTKDRKSQLTLSGGGTFKGDRIESMFNQMAVKKETLRGFVTKLAKRTSAKLNGLNYCQIGQD